jgi:hypothetical protein
MPYLVSGFRSSTTSNAHVAEASIFTRATLGAFYPTSTTTRHPGKQDPDEYPRGHTGAGNGLRHPPTAITSVTSRGIGEPLHAFGDLKS